MRVSITERSRVIAASFALFCLSIFLTAYTSSRAAIAGTGASLMGEVLGPAQFAYSSVTSTLSDIWNSYLALVDVEAENRSLREKIAALEAKLLSLSELEAENVRLARLLDVSVEHELEGLVARVIGYDASEWRQSVVIDRGRNDGVLPGMAVVERGGLVGQVIASSTGSAKVLLVIDPASGVDGVHQTSRARGVVTGDGRQASWDFVLREEEVQVGDRIFTSGLEGIFPRGLLIGTVSSVDERRSGLFKSIEVHPHVDFATLEQVFVVTSPAGTLARSAVATEREPQRRK